MIVRAWVCLALALAAWTTGVGTARAGHDGPLVALELFDRDSGMVLPTYGYQGRRYAVGTPGHRYAVRLRNLGGERVLAVLSVDGINAVTGETAHPRQSGYVLEPGQTADISGWRKNMSEVAQFVFTDLGDSYAARTRRPDHVGVVGVAVFRELPRPAPPPPALGLEPRRSREASAAGESALRDEAGARQRLGTGHGEREWAPTRNVAFQRASRRPARTIELHYDSRERLTMLGIVPPVRPLAGVPRAFPGGFVPDPF